MHAGVLSKQEGAQLLSELPQPQLIAVVEVMAPSLRAEVEEALLALAKPGTPRRRSLRRSHPFCIYNQGYLGFA